MGTGVRRLPASDQPEPSVDGDVVLVAEGRDSEIHGRDGAVGLRLGFGKLQRPARVPVLMTELGRLVSPVLGNAASLDVGLLGIGVALARSCHQRGIDDLPGHGNVTGFPQHGVEPCEQGCYRAALGSTVPGIARSSWYPAPDPTDQDQGIA